jgi:plasmid stabilization system protein ParE
MPRIVVAPAAEADAAEIWAYIARDNPPAATRLLGRFDQLFRTLADQPGVGKNMTILAPEFTLHSHWKLSHLLPSSAGWRGNRPHSYNVDFRCLAAEMPF